MYCNSIVSKTLAGNAFDGFALHVGEKVEYRAYGEPRQEPAVTRVTGFLRLVLFSRGLSPRHLWRRRLGRGFSTAFSSASTAAHDLPIVVSNRELTSFFCIYVVYGGSSGSCRRSYRLYWVGWLWRRALGDRFGNRLASSRRWHNRNSHSNLLASSYNAFLA